MNKLKFVLAFAALSSVISCSEASKPEEVSIVGSIDYPNQWIYLVKPDPWLEKANIIDSSQVDNEGHFGLKASISEFGEYLISGRGFFITTVFLQNGDNLNVEVEGGKNGGARQVSFTGEGSAINNFWHHITTRYFQQGGYDNYYKQLVSTSEPLDFIAQYDAYEKEQMKVLDSFVAAANPPKEFIDWASTYLAYNAASKKYTYLYHKPRAQNLPVPYLEVDDNYYNFLDNLDLKKEPPYLHSAYNEFIYFFINDYKNRNGNGPNSLQKSIDYAKKELPKQAANLAAAHLINDLIQGAATRDDFDQLRTAMDEYETWNDNEKYLDFLKGKYLSKSVLAPGSPAPDFTFKNLAGQDVSVSDFAGKVVVIDFWGTWCGPCKRELPYSRQIEEFYRDREDVVFVFVALERGSRDYWKEFVTSNNLPGIHLYSSNSDKSLMPYKITSVPRYVIVDKEGRIYDAFASRPSQNMKQQIAKVLED